MAELKMPDINNTLIAGKLTNDPMFRKTSNGTPVINFHIASNRKYKDNSGIWRENVCFIGIVAWHKLAETCLEILKKGSSVLVDGELQSRIWRNEDGTTRNVVEIRARRIQFLDRKSTKEIEENAPTETNEEDTTNIPETEQNTSSEDIQVDNTDFDFGYQDLQI